MGKNRVIKTLGKRIGNIVLHELLVKYTNKLESIGHLSSEEIEYRNSAIKDAKRYNWSDEDIKFISLEALKFIKSKNETKYPDVKFSLEEAEDLIQKEIIDLEW